MNRLNHRPQPTPSPLVSAGDTAETADHPIRDTEANRSQEAGKTRRAATAMPQAAPTAPPVMTPIHANARIINPNAAFSHPTNFGRWIALITALAPAIAPTAMVMRARPRRTCLAVSHDGPSSAAPHDLGMI